MSIPHQHTFLRSALVRDPFSLGDLGPEDVLRIESQFPNLFDSGPPKPVQEAQKLKTFETRVPMNKTTGLASTAGHKCCDCKDIKPKVGIGSKPFKAKEAPKPPVTASPRGVVSPFSARPRNTQLLPVSDLKRVLEDLLWQRDLMIHSKKASNNQLQTSSQPKISTVQGQGKQGKAEVKNPPNLGKDRFKNPPEKKRPTNTTKVVPTSQSHPIIPDIRKPKKGRPTYSSLNLAQKKDLLQKALVNLTRQRNSEGIPQTASTPSPGFLRPTILKSKYSSPAPPSSGGNKKSVKFSKDIKPSRKSSKEYKRKRESQKQDRVLVIEKPTQKLEVDPNTLCSPDEETEESNDNALPQMINLKGEGQGDFASKTDNDEGLAEVKSSYFQLKLASGLASKYEKIGLLTKLKFNPDSSAMEKSNSAGQGVSTGNKTSPKKGIMKESPIAPVEPPAPKPNVMEQLAKELVYVEVLKHLQEIQLRDKGEAVVEQDVNNGDQVNTQEKSGLAKVVEETSNPQSSNGLPTTPELTPSDSKPQENRKSSSASVASYDIPTPDLTPSIPLKVNPITKERSPANYNNDNTDCSEISDFTFSDKEFKATPNGLKPSSHRAKSENVLATPQLSSSLSSDYAHKSRRTGAKSSTPGQFDSPDTLDLIASDFDYSSPASNKKQTPLAKINMTPSKPLSSVTEELSTSQKLESKSGSSESKLVSSKQDVESDFFGSGSQQRRLSHKPLTSESEMLSEGEFVGSVYKSPGEISLTQPFTPGQLSTNGSQSQSSTFISETLSNVSQKVVPEVSTGEYLRSN